jgi:hypothetical protein
MEFLSFLQELISGISQDYPLLATFLGGFIALVWYVHKTKEDFFRKLLDYGLKMVGRESIGKIDLDAHPFFYYMASQELNGIDRVEVSSYKKGLILRKFLKIKFKRFREDFKNFSMRGDELDNLSKEQFAKEVLFQFASSINKYGEESKAEFIKLGLEGHTSERIINGLNNHHQTTVDVVEKAIQLVLSSSFFKSNKIRFSVVLFILAIGFMITVPEFVEFVEASKDIDDLKLGKNGTDDKTAFE